MVQVKKKEALDEKNVEDILALTPLQEGMLYHYLRFPDSDIYFEQLCLEISGAINSETFKKAWNFVVESNEMLRAVFRWQKVEKPVQIILKKHELKIQILYNIGNYFAEKKQWMENLEIKDRENKFDLQEVPFRVTLGEIGENKYEMIISSHHILYDGWSNGILLNEFFAAYGRLSREENKVCLSRRPSKSKFKEFIQWIQNQDFRQQEEFWRNYLKGFDSRTEFPVKKRRKREETALTAAGRYYLEFEKKVTDKLEGFVKEFKITLASVFYSAWGILLQKYNDTDDAVFGTTVSGRTAKVSDIEDMVGLFINTIPLRVQTFPHEKTGDFLYRIDNAVQTREVYEHTPLVNIKEYSEIDTQIELFDTIVVIENYPLDRLLILEKRNLSLSVDSCRMFEMTHYDLTICISISGEIEVNFSYNRELFDTDTIERLANHFMTIIGKMIGNPAKKVSEIEIIPQEEKKQILYDFNETGTTYPRDKTIYQLFEEQAEQTPDKIAVLPGRQLAVGKEGKTQAAVQLTYKELNRESNQLARLLWKKGVRPNTIVGVMVERSIEMVSGILAILKAGGAYLPIEADYPEERIRWVLEDSGTKILLTQGKLIRNVDFNGEVINVEEKSLYHKVKRDRDFEAINSPGDLIYVIYTSGSTGRPKGVMVKIKSFVNLLNWYTGEFKFSVNDRVLLIAPISFDLAQKNLFSPLIKGGCLCLSSPGLIDYHELSDFIAREQITITNCAPSVFYPIVEFNMAADFNQLKSLRVVFLGGETIQGNKLLPWVNSVSFGCEIVNTYGPTECTDIASFYRVSPNDIKNQKIIPIGGPIDNVKLFILARNRDVLPIGLIGELCIGGIGLSKGYYNNKLLTGKKFIKTPHLPEKMVYRTGDLGYWLPDGNIEFSGRIDNQVKIRGFRIEPAEIENQLLRHADIKEAVVSDREMMGASGRIAGGGSKYLCAYIISEKELDVPGLKKYLSASLPGYMIPSYFIRLDEIPLTPNGKVDRKSLPGPIVGSKVEYAAPGDEVEKKLVEIWWEVLFGRDASRTTGAQPPLNPVPHLKIGIHHHFFELGGHSLTATRLQARIQKEFNVKVPLAEIFENPYIKNLSASVKKASIDRYQSIEAVEKKEYYALSSAQQRLYILDQVAVESKNTGYNISGMFLLQKKSGWLWLENIFQRLIKRHESLRTSFHLVEDQPVQKVHDKVAFEIEYYDLYKTQVELKVEEEEGTRGLAPLPIEPAARNSQPAAALISSFIRPFDLSQAPLLRAGLVEVDKGKYLLMVDMHHIISDEFSIGIMQKEMTALYDLEELPPLKIQYKDYSRWQKREIGKGKIHSQKAYWVKEFPGEIPVLNLACDYVRPSIQGFEGRTLGSGLGVREARALKGLTKKEGITLYMVILAIYNILLAKLGSQEDVVVGTPVAGRRHADLEPIVGMFVNTLALRNFPSSQKTFKGFLNEVKKNTLAAFENQDYPFEKLVDQVSITRDTSRNPLFDVMFAVQNQELTDVEIPGLKLKSYPFESGISKFDLTLQVVDRGDKLQFAMEYCTKLFKKETIERFIIYFKNVVSTIVSEPGSRICEIEIISEEEKRKILYDFNNTGTDYPKDKTIHRLLEEQARRTPDHRALLGMINPKFEIRNRASNKQIQMTKIQNSKQEGTGRLAPMYITYKELNKKSDQLARILKKKGILSDNIVGIMVERSIEMIIGVWGILKAGGAYLPIDPEYPAARINYMLSDSQAKILLTTKNIAKAINFDKEMIYLNSSSPQASLNLSEGRLFNSHHSSKNRITHHSKSLAYVIYTSGSTGKPRGVMIRHRSVVNRINWMQRFYPIGNDDVILQKTPFTFDVSVWEIFWWSFQGASLCLLGPGHEKSPGAIIAALGKNKVTTMHFVPSMLNVFLEYLEELAAVDYTSLIPGLRQVFSSGEALWGYQVEKFNRLLNKKNRTQLINLYGPTEATVDVSYFNCPAGERQESISIPIGKPIDNIRLYVVDKNMRLQPIGVTGELCIAGVGMARGYLNNPGLTNKKFLIINDKLKIKNGINKKLPGKRSYIYKTGDLARWLPDGNIEFLGRMDHQVKIRGFRIELQEIESQLLTNSSICSTAAAVKETKRGDKYLCAYIISDKEVKAPELREYLSNTLPDYMIPSFFVQLESFPLTPNGKVDRKALPQPDVGICLEYVAPGNEVEKKLQEIWANVLEVDKKFIGIDNNFFELGGHSLTAAILLTRIHKEFGVKLSWGELFKNPLIRKLAESVKAASKESYQSIKAVEAKEYYVLSSAQQRLYLLDQVEVESKSTVYNIPGIFLLGKKTDRYWLKNAFKKLIARHESLRTSFHLVGESPVQKVHDHVEFEIEYYDLAAENTVEENSKFQISNKKETERHHSSFIIHHSFVRPFDLSQAPLLRVGLAEVDKGTYLLMVDMHHIISDGFSIGIMQREMASLYDLEELPPLQIQYKDYCMWQKREIEKGKSNSQKVYWLNEFPGEIPVLALPYDYVRPSMQNFEGKAIRFELGVGEPGTLKELAKKEGTTFYMVILAIYTILLAKLGNQEDVVVGTPVAGRRHADLEQIVAVFVNMLALRNFPSGQKTFKGFLNEVKEKTLDAFENQDYPFENLVSQVTVTRDVSRNPLFDVLFTLQDMETPGLEPSGLKLTPVEFEITTSKLDIALQGFTAGQKLLFTIEYKTKLFKQETIQRFVNYFISITRQVSNDPGIRISGIDILSQKEKHRLLFEFNDTQIGYPKDKTISELFTRQAETTPGNIALHGCMDAWMHGEGHITYCELNKKSDQLAGLLKEKGVKPDTIVGIMVKRSVEMVIGILAILKADGAYLPIDPDYPQERIDYMLTDSNAKVLVTTPGLSGKFEKLSIVNCQLLMVNEKPSNRRRLNTPPQEASPHLHLPLAPVTCLAYIIYTSGSTGKPKGTLIEHRNVARLVKNSNYIDFSPGDRLLMTGAFAFDITTFEIWGALLNGLSLYITDGSTIPYAEKLGKAITRNQVSILHLVPQLFNQVAAEDIEIFAGLRYFLVGGDLVKPQHINELRRKYSRLKILHMYGPTENTTFSTFFPVEKNCETRIPIGKPISHSLVYILDRHGKLQPLGVVGELCTGGDGVARGYLNNPELTHEKFLIINDKLKIKNGSGALRAGSLNAFGEGKAHEKHEKKVPGKKIHMSYMSHMSYIYKTGDLARWLPDENIEFLGRMDHQVKIRGIRIEPGEIEKKLMDIDYIRDAVVIDREDGKGEKYLVAYVVSNKDEVVNVSGLKNVLSGVLPAYMIPSFFVHLQEIPITPNGKADRESLPDPGIGTAVQYVAPRDEVENRLVKIWSNILARDPVHASQLQASLGIDHNFFELGGHSLRAALLLSRVCQAFDIKFSLSKIFNGPTIREMARLVKNSKKNIYQDIKPVEKRDYYPLSSAQKRLFFLDQLEDIGTSYNIPSVHRVKGKPGKKRYEDCFKALIKRHEALRTSFVLINNHPVQRVHDEVEFEIEYYEPGSSVNNEGGEREEVEKMIQNFVRPFNLAKAPLLRLGFILFPGIEDMLLFDIHHIIGDGTSTGILIDDFKQLYPGEKLPLLKVQYKDFSIWQNNLFETGKIKSRENYWLDLLAGEIPVLDILPDNPRPPVLSFEGGNYRFFLEKEYTEKYLLLSEEMGATLYMNLLASFNVLFFKYTNMEDIIVGTGIMGRSHVDLQKIVGMFVNTLVMRNYPRGDKSYWEFFKEVKENSLNAFENQDVQFEELVRQLNLERDPSRNPIFDVTFVVQNFERSTISAAGITIEPYKRENKTSKFDLTLFAYEDEVKHRLVFNVEYATKLFERKTVEKIANHFIEIIKQVIRSKHIMLKDISLTHAFLDSQAGNIKDEQGDFGF